MPQATAPAVSRDNMLRVVRDDLSPIDIPLVVTRPGRYLCRAWLMSQWQELSEHDRPAGAIYVREAGFVVAYLWQGEPIESCELGPRQPT